MAWSFPIIDFSCGIQSDGLGEAGQFAVSTSWPNTQIMFAQISTKSLFFLASMFLAPIIFLGCGSPEDTDLVLVKGILTENGKPFKLDESKIQLPKGASAPPPGSEGLRIVFIHIESNEQFPAKFSPETSTFEVAGSKGKGIKAGHYKISITANYAPNSRDGQSGDYFGGLFTREKTQIIRDVKAGEEISIDVAKPTG